MNITLLTASDSTPLTKKFTLDERGRLVKHPYPHVGKFSSKDYQVHDLKGFMSVLRAAPKTNACLLKGVVTRTLDNESRRDSHDATEPTGWICLDVDGDASGQSVDKFLENIGLGDVEYILQASCSAGIGGKSDLRCHVFMLLDEEVEPSLLKSWLTKLNLETGSLVEQLQLTASARGLKYVLDVSTCQNDKLLYILPPVLGEGVESAFKGNRFTLVTKGKAVQCIDTSSVLGRIKPASVNALKQQHIAKLRKDAGFPTAKERSKPMGGHSVCQNPEAAQVTGTLDCGEFIRLNLNGGSSWAYWHPYDNVEIIYSFKDETAVLAKNLIPEYHAEYQGSLDAEHDELIQREVIEDPHNSNIKHLAFTDKATDKHYYGTHDEVSLKTEVFSTNKRQVVQDFWANFGLEQKDFIPLWNYEFRPTQKALDEEAQFLNRWYPSSYERDAEQPGAYKDKVPPQIKKVLLHVFNNDVEIYNHFLNWLACILQFKMRTETAFLIHGCPGTGKGFLFSKILSPILGRDFTDNRNLRDFANRFRSSAPDKFITMVDEADVDGMSKQELDQVISNFKHQITEERVHYELKHVDSQLLYNYANYLIASNRIIPLVIEEGDRRFNISPRQEKKLKMNDAVAQLVKEELQDFTNYLMAYPADKAVARRVIDNEVKRDLITQHLSSLSEAASALKHGDLEYFTNRLPFKTSSLVADEHGKLGLIHQYETIIALILHYGDQAFQHPRDHLITLCAFVERSTPHDGKFDTFLRKAANLKMKNITPQGDMTQGLAIKWTITDYARQSWEAYLKRFPMSADHIKKLGNLSKYTTK